MPLNNVYKAMLNSIKSISMNNVGSRVHNAASLVGMLGTACTKHMEICYVVSKVTRTE